MNYLYIGIMALVTYAIRALPLTLVTRPIRSAFLRRFLLYVPYACLAAMTIPSIFSATESVYSAIVGLAVTMLMTWRNGRLVVVAAAGCAAVFVTETVMRFAGML